MKIKKINYNRVQSNRNNRNHSGREALIIIMLSLVLVIIIIFSILIAPEKINKVRLNFPDFKTKATEVSGRAKKIDSPFIILNIPEETNNNLEIKLNSGNKISTTYPDIFSLLSGENSNSMELVYNYLKQISEMLKAIGEDSLVDSSDIKALSYSILDYAQINYALTKTDNYQSRIYFDTKSKDFSQNIFFYLDMTKRSLKQVTDKSSSAGNFYNPFTDINQVDYVKNISNALSKVQSNTLLANDLKVLAEIAVKDSFSIANNIILTVNTDQYNLARPIITKVIEDANIDKTFKTGLLETIGLDLTEKEQASALINALLSILTIEPDALNKLNQSEREKLINAIASIRFEQKDPVSEIVESYPVIAFNCIRKGKAFSNGKCSE